MKSAKLPRVVTPAGAVRIAFRLRETGIRWGPDFDRAYEATLAGKLVIVRDGIVSIRK